MRPLLIALSALWILLGTYFLSNTLCGVGGNNPVFSVHDGDFKSSANDVFSFGFNSSSMNSSKETNKVFKDVAAYLQKNENKQLSLFGLVSSNEKKENLGMARAEAVKKKITTLGALPVEVAERIVVDTRKVDNYHSSSNAITNHVDFVFNNLEAATDSGDDASTEAEDIGSSVMRLSFDAGQVKAVATPQFENYMYKLREYINNHPGAKVIVTGYTDDQGSNLDRISKDRAKSVRRLFRHDNLFASKEVVAKGKGKADPIADNDSEQGRKANNRVEVRVEH